MPRIHPVSLLGLLAVVALAGCASGQMSRIDRNRDIYEAWPIEIRQAVLDGRVEPGMDPEMVRVSWGEPSEVVTQSNTGDEIWVYKSGGSQGSVMYPGGGGLYPAGTYPGGYPGGVYPSTGPGITIGSGGGGTSIGLGGGVGIGGGGMGGAAPIYMPPTPPEIKEVVFRNGVVHRADQPTTKP